MNKTWLKNRLLDIRQMWPLFPAAAYLLGFFLIVLVYLIGFTFSIEKNGEYIFPAFGTVAKLISQSQFRQALFNTAVFVAIGTPLELVTGFILALLLYKSFRFRGTIRSLFLIPLAIPALVTATMLFILFDFPGGHINHLLMGKYAFPGIISEPINWRGSAFFALGISMLGKVWRDMPISMLILLAGINTIDPELFDAAKTMGASLRKRILSIVLPLMIPSISAVLLLRSIEMWKEFIFPFILAGKYNLLGTLVESLYNDWRQPHEAAAVALIIVLCIAITLALLMAVMEWYKKKLLRGSI